MFQACDVISDSQLVCFTPSLTKTSSASGRDVNSDCGPGMKYHNLTNELAVSSRNCFFELVILNRINRIRLHCVECLSEHKN